MQPLNNHLVQMRDFATARDNSCADDPYLDLLQGVDVNPIFIMGLHRSGTSILYHTLTATHHFNVVTAFHLVHQNRLLSLHLHPQEKVSYQKHMLQWFENLKLTKRNYDSIPIGPDLPEEYCYALDYLGLKPKLTSRNSGKFLEFARKIQFVEHPDRPLLLKNPWDTGNFLEVRRVIPAARFIFIHRNPVPVISSQLRMFGGLIQRASEYDMLIEDSYRRFCESRVLRNIARAICSDSLPFLLWRICRNATMCCDYMVSNVKLLGEAAINLSYSQLCQETNQTVRQILRFLGLDDNRSIDYSSLIHPRKQLLHPRVERIKSEIENRTRQYCQMFGVAPYS